MKKYLTFIIILYSITGLWAQNLIAVQSGSQVNFYTDFHTALHAAPSGATIYLPGGTFVMPTGKDTVSQPVNIIGVGHYPDSTLATGITQIPGNLFFANGSNNSLIEGVWFSTGGLYLVSGAIVNNLVLNRCNLWVIDCDNILVSQCIVNQLISANLTVSNSIVTTINYGVGSTVNHNIIGSISGPQNSSSGSVISNNIFLDSLNGSDYIVNDIIENNIFFQATSYFLTGYNSVSNCVFGYTLSSLFVNIQPYINSSSGYTQNNWNFHTVASSLASGAATDGTDIGIYGGASPYKDGAVPSNPHIQYINIASQTSGGGNLPVNIHTAAQSY